MINWKQFAKPEKRLRPFIYSILFFCTLALLVNEIIYQQSQNKLVPASIEKIKVESQYRKLLAQTPATISAPTVNLNQNYKTEGVNVPILLYHYVGNNPNPKDLARNALSVTLDDFENQMAYLKNNGYTAIGFETLLAAI